MDTIVKVDLGIFLGVFLFSMAFLAYFFNEVTEIVAETTQKYCKIARIEF